jgi:hypothetical protein
MIGQKRIQDRISTLIQNGTFPRFTILTGQFGSGKKTLAKQIAKQLGGFVISVEPKVANIREMIEQCYKTTAKTIYVLADADGMSLAARNALLKVIEEPPNNAYFIMTLQDSMNTLDTIRSRGMIFQMDAYTPAEIKMCVGTTTDEKLLNRFVQLCDTPYAVQLVKSYNLKQFSDYVNLVVDNVALVSGSNSFKIADKIAVDGDDTKYDLTVFWRAFSYECLSRLKSDPLKYSRAIEITSTYIQDLRTSSLNRSCTFDMWLLDIRAEWMNLADD